MKLIVGLGNPGNRYLQTRHNIGFRVLDRLAKHMISNDKNHIMKSDWGNNKKFMSQIIKSKQLILAKPQTFMNESGVAVRKIMNFYQIRPENLWIIYDDIDLPLGKIRIKSGGSSGGHHGIDSVIEHTGTNRFSRFRLGIGRSGIFEKNVPFNDGVVNHVLTDFTRDEKVIINQSILLMSQVISESLTDGIEKTMNKYN